MSDSILRIFDEFDKLKGQFVITDSWQIERLVAIGEDDMDYYYVTYNDRDLKWHTCVGRIIPLKGYLREKDYNYLIHIAKLNDYGNMNIFLKSLDEYLSKHHEGNKFLTEFCWDLN